jgi:RNA polymerase sigma factor (TIGR02999 family)
MSQATDLPPTTHDEPRASEQLLPLVYDELRRLAAHKLAWERAGQTLQPTALVHEAYLRLTGDGEPPRWDSPGHFFAAAAEAMRRILVENARRRQSKKRGGELSRQDLTGDTIAAPTVPEDVLALDEALARLEAAEPRIAKVVKLRYFAGLTLRQAAEVLGISPRTADVDWAYARAWLLAELQPHD